MESYVAIRMARCFRLSLLCLIISLSSQWKLFKYQKVWNKKKTIVIVFLQHKCVFSTQIRQNAFRICVYVLNSTRQNIYFVLFHAHMAQLACMRAFSVRNQFILFVQSCSSTSMSWISLLSSFKSVKINHELRFGVVLETTLNNLPFEIKRWSMN